MRNFVIVEEKQTASAASKRPPKNSFSLKLKLSILSVSRAKQANVLFPVRHYMNKKLEKSQMFSYKI